MLSPRNRLLSTFADHSQQLDDLDSLSRSLYDTLTASRIENASYFDQILLEIRNLQVRTANGSKPSSQGPFHITPFERDSGFVGRQDILEALENAFTDHGRRALTGQSGIG